jgi:hypothetical protein
MEAAFWFGSVVLSGVLGNLATDVLKALWRRSGRGNRK